MNKTTHIRFLYLVALASCLFATSLQAAYLLWKKTGDPACKTDALDYFSKSLSDPKFDLKSFCQERFRDHRSRRRCGGVRSVGFPRRSDPDWREGLVCDPSAAR